MTTLRELFDQVDLILLDFDGPVTRLLPPPKNAELAMQAKSTCLTFGVNLSPAEAISTDHLVFIRAAGKHSRDSLIAVETLCTAGEVEAAGISPLTCGARELLEAAGHHGKTVVIVTNNSPECVERFLVTHELSAYVSRIIGRHPLKPDLMKPNAHILVEALKTSHRKALMIGDSVSDIEAAAAADVPAVGLAKNLARAQDLERAGAAAVVFTMLGAV